MSGKLLNIARQDAAKIINSGGFEEDIILTNPQGVSKEVKGLHTKHWINYDTQGLQVNSKNAHILINEEELIEKGFETRNLISKNVDLRKWKVSVPDSSIMIKQYLISETYPSETFGLIVCILKDYDS